MIDDNYSSSHAVEITRRALEEAVLHRHARVLTASQAGLLRPSRGGLEHILRLFRQAEARLSAFNAANPGG